MEVTTMRRKRMRPSLKASTAPRGSAQRVRLTRDAAVLCAVRQSNKIISVARTTRFVTRVDKNVPLVCHVITEGVPSLGVAARLCLHPRRDACARPALSRGGHGRGGGRNRRRRGDGRQI